MKNLNKVMLIGNLTRDPQIRRTSKDVAVADLGLALNRSYQSESGERQEETTFVDVTVWNRLAETAEQYLHKGRAVYIEGRLQLDTWTDRESGQKRQKLKVVGERMDFADAPGDSGSASSSASQDRGSSRSQQQQRSGGTGHRDSSEPVMV